MRKRREQVYLIPLEPYEDEVPLKRRLARCPGVYRITSHGGHLKVNSLLPLKLKREVVVVPDQTTHWDPKYWDFAMRAFRYAVRKGHDNNRALSVMIHYLCNLFVARRYGEAEYLAAAGLARARLEATMTEEEAHGWELAALRRAKKRHRKGVKP